VGDTDSSQGNGSAAAVAGLGFLLERKIDPGTAAPEARKALLFGADAVCG
jgi:hypothetical protein